MNIVKKIIALSAVVLITGCNEEKPQELNFRATGNEPAWALIINGNSANITRNYGEDIVTIMLNDNESDNVDNFLFSGTDGDVVINIEKTDCQDSMADMVFLYTVNIKIGADELSGCGRIVEEK